MRTIPFLLVVIVLAGCTRTPVVPAASSVSSSTLAHQVLQDVALPDVTDPKIVASTVKPERVIVIGQRRTNYVAVLAARFPEESSDRWSLYSHQYKLTDGCVWRRSSQEFDHVPTRRDVDSLLADFFALGAPKDFLFTGDLK